jgi:PIN domain nuclease of toxin-antitoxin system
MRILLDTHVLLWFSLNDSHLSREWMEMIQDARNEKFISIASVWELAIKSGLGKLRLEAPFKEFVNRNVTENGMGILHTTIEHFAEVQHLPHHHRDPFDRLIIAQSIVEHIGIITADPQFEKYNVELI